MGFKSVGFGVDVLVLVVPVSVVSRVIGFLGSLGSRVGGFLMVVAGGIVELGSLGFWGRWLSDRNWVGGGGGLVVMAGLVVVD